MEANKDYLDILVSPEFKEYKEVGIIVKQKPYLIKVPDVTYSSALKNLANAKIRRILEGHSPGKVGRKLKYRTEEERRKANTYVSNKISH